METTFTIEATPVEISKMRSFSTDIRPKRIQEGVMKGGSKEKFEVRVIADSPELANKLLAAAILVSKQPTQ